MTRKYILLRTCLALASVLSAALLIGGVASAHERRPIAGKYDVVVGFDKEPAFVSEQNAAAIRITRAGTQDPVAGVEKTLKIKLAFGGGEAKEFPLRSVFGQAGYYVADFFPTSAGTYIFTFVGDIEGTPVNERFESGPGRFNDVQDASSVQFPRRSPDPATMSAQLQSAQDAADNARNIAVAGLLIGLVGLVVGGLGLMSRRSSSNALARSQARAR
jgi:hypothetical protein